MPTHLITSLPGWDGALFSSQFSGYLSLASGKQVHYHFVESESAPTEDPVVVWLNGGPGCSSYIGFWEENGPFTINGDGTLSTNAGRWNTKANVLFLEAPVGVGFSYWPGTPQPWAADDNTTAADNLAALSVFFTSFPSFKALPLFISGESYAGVYVPMLAAAILAAPSAGLNLKGVLVGNGALATGDWYEGGLVQQRMEHAFQHGLFSAGLKANIDGNCTDWVNRSDACNNLLGVMSDQMGPLNAYNIEITCGSSSAQHTQRRALLTGRVDAFGSMDKARYSAGTGADADPCSVQTDALTAYLSDPAVISSLHVGAGAAVLGPWADCASGASLAYTRIPQDERITVYPSLLSSIAVLIFNGDQDECIPYIQDMSWTAGMGYPVKAGGDWRPWVVENQVAGYVTEFASPVRFTFVTVKRAGHEVPMYQPERALQMLHYHWPRLVNHETRTYGRRGNTLPRCNVACSLLKLYSASCMLHRWAGFVKC